MSSHDQTKFYLPYLKGAVHFFKHNKLQKGELVWAWSKMNLDMYVYFNLCW